METVKTQQTTSLKRTTGQKPVYSQMVAQIRQMIKDGELAPGDQLLPERELAEAFKVSRTSVRQALAVLDGMGVIEITPRDGAYVRQRSLQSALEPLTQVLFQQRESVSHLFEVRQIIETQAARLAAIRREEADLERLWALNQQYEAGLDNWDLAYKANIAFHIGIVETAKNPVLSEVMSTLLTATMEVYASARNRAMSERTDLLRFVNEHAQIIEAIAQQDTGLAVDLMARHIDDARKRVKMEIAD